MVFHKVRFWGWYCLTPSEAVELVQSFGVGCHQYSDTQLCVLTKHQDTAVTFLNKYSEEIESYKTKKKRSLAFWMVVRQTWSYLVTESDYWSIYCWLLLTGTNSLRSQSKVFRILFHQTTLSGDWTWDLPRFVRPLVILNAGPSPQGFVLFMIEGMAVSLWVLVKSLLVCLTSALFLKRLVSIEARRPFVFQLWRLHSFLEKKEVAMYSGVEYCMRLPLKTS